VADFIWATVGLPRQTSNLLEPVTRILMGYDLRPCSTALELARAS
jgi:hypothetical protein